MWMAGALGVASGAGHYMLAIVAALLSFVILRFIQSPRSSPDSSRESALIIEEDEEGEDTDLRR
jgi:uncharacterized membrane protein YhiD involved in acid resistance